MAKRARSDIAEADAPQPAADASVKDRLSWAALLLLLVGWTFWIDLGRFHKLTDADSLIPVLVSVLHWTPFYWEQDRYGMLVPLLALPFQQPVVNLVVQSACTILAGLACFFLLARYFFSTTSWRIIGLLAIAWTWTFSDRDFAAWLSITLFYAPSLALGLGALLTVEGLDLRRRNAHRWVAATVMMIAAHWVNFTIGLCRWMRSATRSSGSA